MKKSILHSWRDKTTEFFDNLIDDSSHTRAIRQAAIQQFHQLYYNAHFFSVSECDTSWMGFPAEKCPMDLWVYQEIIFEIKPDIIIECGTGKGGTTLFLAHLCDMMKKGKVISVDIEADLQRPQHERISYLTGISTSEEVINQLKTTIIGELCVLVILDDDHHKNHVLKELYAYQELVTKGSYLIIEDTNLNGHPVFREYGEGPMEAVEEFLKTNKDFEIDKRREKFFLTFNPNGFLKRIN